MTSSQAWAISVAFSARENVEVLIGQGGGFLQVAESMDDFDWHGGRRTNREILDGALGLGAPEFFGGHFDCAHGVFFGACGHDLCG